MKTLTKTTIKLSAVTLFILAYYTYTRGNPDAAIAFGYSASIMLAFNFVLFRGIRK